MQDQNFIPYGVLSNGIGIWEDGRRRQVKYHLRREEKAIGDESTIRRMLREGRYVTIAMSRQDEPYLVAMNYGWDESANCLYFHCAKEGQKMDFLRARGSSCLMLIEDHGYRAGECDHAYRSLVLRGSFSEVKEIEGKLHAFEVMIDHLEEDPLPVKRRMLARGESIRAVAVLRFEIESITGKKSI